MNLDSPSPSPATPPILLDSGKHNMALALTSLPGCRAIGFFCWAIRCMELFRQPAKKADLSLDALALGSASGPNETVFNGGMLSPTGGDR